MWFSSWHLYNLMKVVDEVWEFGQSRCVLWISTCKTDAVVLSWKRIDGQLQERREVVVPVGGVQVHPALVHK